jgi:hypothetical protein
MNLLAATNDFGARNFPSIGILLIPQKRGVPFFILALPELRQH